MQASFNAKSIVSQKLRYCYVIEKMPTEVVEEVTDLPEENHYDTLKTAIIKRTGKSNETMQHGFFNNVQLGNLTHSELLKHTKSILGPTP